MRFIAWVLLIGLVMGAVIGTLKVKKMYVEYNKVQKELSVVLKQKELINNQLFAMSQENLSLKQRLEDVMARLKQAQESEKKYIKGAKSLYE